jgi:hypothetical protein
VLGVVESMIIVARVCADIKEHGACLGLDTCRHLGQRTVVECVEASLPLLSVTVCRKSTQNADKPRPTAQKRWNARSSLM